MAQMAEMIRYYMLAYGTATPPVPGEVVWPYEVGLCFDDVPRPVALSEGTGHCSSGALFTAVEALTPTFSKHFALAQGEWLFPALCALAAGYRLDKELLLSQYKALHATAPPTFDIERAKI